MLDLIDPASGEVFRTVEKTHENAVLDSLERMRRAQAEWARAPIRERVRIARHFIEALGASMESIALDVTRQMGKPLERARHAVTRALERAEAMCELAPLALADDALRPKPGFRRYIRHEPLGVVLDIPAWNYPLFPTRT